MAKTELEISLENREKFAVKEVSKDLAKRVLEVVDLGLSDGVGEPIPGKMCVEAAVCYAMGQEHNDDPICVHSAVREGKIILNDNGWSTPKARANGMRRLAVAQLGSTCIDGDLFLDTFASNLMKLLLPDAIKECEEKDLPSSRSSRTRRPILGVPFLSKLNQRMIGMTISLSSWIITRIRCANRCTR